MFLYRTFCLCPSFSRWFSSSSSALLLLSISCFFNFKPKETCHYLPISAATHQTSNISVRTKSGNISVPNQCGLWIIWMWILVIASVVGACVVLRTLFCILDWSNCICCLRLASAIDPPPPGYRHTAHVQTHSIHCTHIVCLDASRAQGA